MNRRSFVRRIAVAVASTLIAAKLPLDTIQKIAGVPATRESATALLKRVYNRFYRECGHTPERILVSRSLFDAFVGECKAIGRYIERPGDEPPTLGTLYFKSSRMEIFDGFDESSYDYVLIGNERKLMEFLES